MARSLFIPLLFLLATAPATAQYDVVGLDTVPDQADTVLTLKELNRSPRRALLWSIIPGGGQVYNRAWWKVPIVYGGLLGIVAVADFNQAQYNRVVTALEARCLGDGNVIQIPFAECVPRENELSELPTQGLINSRNGANRRRQTAFFLILAGYVMQSVEAFTDAHLREFDISDDLSLQLGPMTTPEGAAALGLRLPLHDRGRRRQENHLSRLGR